MFFLARLSRRNLRRDTREIYYISERSDYNNDTPKNGISETGNGDYVDVPPPTTPKNEANNGVRIPCIICHHNTEASSFDFFNYESSSNFETGATNTVFGTVGAFSSGAYMIGTDGIGVELEVQLLLRYH